MDYVTKIKLLDYHEYSNHINKLTTYWPFRLIKRTSRGGIFPDSAQSEPKSFYPELWLKTNCEKRSLKISLGQGPWNSF